VYVTAGTTTAGTSTAASFCTTRPGPGAQSGSVVGVGVEAVGVTLGMGVEGAEELATVGSVTGLSASEQPVSNTAITITGKPRLTNSDDKLIRQVSHVPATLRKPQRNLHCALINVR
jgi:hypothetical protein